MKHLLTAGALALASMIAPAGAQESADVSEMTLGQPDAPVTVVEYASFTCPHCATFHQGPLQELKAEYVESGQVRFVYREVYFDRYGLWASMIARCGGADRFFGIADMLYDKQSEWTDGEPAAVADNLRRIGKLAGLSAESVDACLNDRDTAQALVAWYQQNAEADGVTSTPTLLINGEKHSNMPYDELAALIEAELGE
jgi:protein-disulfide isomerase